MDSPVRISVSGCAPDGPGRWRATFVIRNAGGESLRLEDVWLPHGRFRGDGHLSPGAALPPGGSHELELAVSAHEEIGTVVENAFLILRVRAGDQAWRVFARMRVMFDDPAGTPRPVVEAVSAQRL